MKVALDIDTYNLINEVQVLSECLVDKVEHIEEGLHYQESVNKASILAFLLMDKAKELSTHYNELQERA